MKRLNFVTFFLTVKHSLPMKAVLRLLYARNHIAFAVAKSSVYEPFVCKLGTAVVLPVYVPRSWKHNAIWRQQKVDLGMAHAQCKH